jgi:hypothetical protein
MNIKLHNVNFKPKGAWFILEDGRGLYLGYRRKRDLYAKRNAVGIERIALEQTQDWGLKYAGIVMKEGKRKLFYATPVEDFFGPDSFTHPQNILQRCLPLSRFRITPSMRRENVEAAMKLR